MIQNAPPGACRFLPLLAGAVLLATPAQAALPESFVTFFDTYCIDCHDADTAKGDFLIDLLKAVETPEDAEYWKLTLDNLHLGEMPPEDKKQPTPAELAPVIAWIEEGLARAATKLKGHTGEVVLRRFNRTEYENTIEDLFDVRGDYAEGFPEDAKEEGFDNIGAALMMSTEQLDAYLAATDFILNRAIVTTARPETKSATFTLHDLNRENWKRTEQQLAKTLDQFDDLTAAEKELSLKRNIDGVTNGYHPLSHHGMDPGNIAQLKLIEKALFEELKILLTNLRNDREGDATLLDRTTIIVTSNLGSAASHSNKDLPVLLIGGNYNHGSHLAFEPGAAPLSSLYVSVLNQFGLAGRTFATATGPLKGLEIG